jgi:hypothetical protein
VRLSARSAAASRFIFGSFAGELAACALFPRGAKSSGKQRERERERGAF